MANEDPDGDGQLFVYNLRLPGQYYDQETALNYNYFRDYDPQVGRYLEPDPIGLKAGVNTYIYVNDSPVFFVDPDGLAASTIQCDGKGDYEVVNVNKGCDANCSRAHEESHIADWKAKYGADSCRNKKKGYLPHSGPGYDAFLKQSECKAYRIGKACREQQLNIGCKCAALESGIMRDNSYIAVDCAGGP
jgi:RHS repeat-associated protein